MHARISDNSKVIRNEGKIIRTGNSSALRLPANIMKATGMQLGDPVEIEASEKSITITLARKADILSYDLAQLVAGITAHNLHGEIDFGRPVGQELL